MPTGEAQAEGAAAKRIYIGDAKHAENGTHEKVGIRCCVFTSTFSSRMMGFVVGKGSCA